MSNKPLVRATLTSRASFDEGYKKEIRMCIYDENRFDGFSERARKLIKKDS
jgi:hypothetical protein